MAVTKIPSDFFRYPEFMAFVLLPVTWGALPLAGFAPTFYQAYLPPMVYQNLLNAQVSLLKQVTVITVTVRTVTVRNMYLN